MVLLYHTFTYMSTILCRKILLCKILYTISSISLLKLSNLSILKLPNLFFLILLPILLLNLNAFKLVFTLYRNLWNGIDIPLCFEVKLKSANVFIPNTKFLNTLSASSCLLKSSSARNFLLYWFFWVYRYCSSIRHKRIILTQILNLDFY